MGQLGVLWGSSAPRERDTSPPGSWGREGRLVCPAPSQGDDPPLCLPWTPARREQFNPLHLCPPAGRSCWDPLVRRCWQRLGERLAQIGAHLPGSQDGSLPSLTDTGTTMGKRCPARIQRATPTRFPGARTKLAADDGSLATRHGNAPAMEPFPCPPRAASIARLRPC